MLTKITRRRIAFVFAIVVLFASTAFKILDPQSENIFLRQFADLLHERGIDVMLDWNSNSTTEGRPVLAPLTNYILPPASNDKTYTDEWAEELEKWVAAYDDGDIDIITAVSKSGNTANQKWEDATISNRIFISYSREDEAIAAKVRQVLELKGYTVFTFLNGSDKELKAERIAYYISTAGNRLVIDTEGARTKPGVLAESLAESKYKFAKSERLTREISSLQKRVEDELTLRHWKQFYPDMRDEEIKSKVDVYKKQLKNVLQENQVSGRVQINIIRKVTEALSICPSYNVPKIDCPICGPRIAMH